MSKMEEYKINRTVWKIVQKRGINSFKVLILKEEQSLTFVSHLDHKK